MITTSDLKSTIKEIIKIHNVIMISGAPGIGKSEITYQAANELGMKLYETRLYEMGEAAVGFPKVHGEITEFSKPFWFHECEEGNYDILFLDDFHLVVPGIQKFLYRLFTDRMMHNYKLKNNPKIIIAGNFDIDSASSCQIQSPIMGRVECFIKYEPNIDVFLEWAKGEMDRFDTRILAFLTSNPDLLFDSDPAPSVKYPSPRSWEHLSRNIRILNKPDYSPAIIGPKAGAIFSDFWEFLSKSVSSILNSKPQDIKEECIYAIILSNNIARDISKYKGKLNDQMRKIFKYVSRNLSVDTSFIFARNAYQNINKEDKQGRLNLVKILQKEFPEIAKNIMDIIIRKDKLMN